MFTWGHLDDTVLVVTEEPICFSQAALDRGRLQQVPWGIDDLDKKVGSNELYVDRWHFRNRAETE